MPMKTLTFKMNHFHSIYPYLLFMLPVSFLGFNYVGKIFPSTLQNVARVPYGRILPQCLFLTPLSNAHLYLWLWVTYNYQLLPSYTPYRTHFNYCLPYCCQLLCRDFLLHHHHFLYTKIIVALHFYEVNTTAN